MVLNQAVVTSAMRSQSPVIAGIQADGTCCAAPPLAWQVFNADSVSSWDDGRRREKSLSAIVRVANHNGRSGFSRDPQKEEGG